MRASRRFERWLDHRPLATRALLLGLAGVYLWTGFAQRGHVPLWARLLGIRREAVMLRFGARDGERVADGEAWRLLTHGFLHWDASHLLMNGLALWGLGRLAEAVFGPARFLWCFLLSVLGGGLLSQTGPIEVVSAGASGGVFGLLGALVVFGWRRRPWMPTEMRHLFGRRLWPWILVNLAIGLLLPFVDNRAHIGGLLAGAVCGAVFTDRVTDNHLPHPLVTSAIRAADVLLFVGAAGAIAAHALER